jgi:hypothetical protein
LDYSVYDARLAGFGKVVFVIRPELQSLFKELVDARFGRQVPVGFVFQRPTDLPSGFGWPRERTKPWGTTHAILAAMNAIHEPFGVINVDDFYGADSYRAVVSHLQSGSPDYALVGYILRNTLPEEGSVARALCEVDENGHLNRITEMQSVERAGRFAKCLDSNGREILVEASKIVSMNMWGFTPSVFELLADQFEQFLELHENELWSECPISESINQLLVGAKVKIRVLHSADTCFGLTYQDDHARVVANVRHLIECGRYPRMLWRETMRDVHFVS